uniref:alpha-protein kinase 2 n=1 Tax=Panthera onca TaxID=9690 RepID=UPI0029551A45|nr:alpha-protein kinase 2 [Panthera onca]
MLLDFFKSSVLDLDKIQEKEWPHYRFYFDEETEAQRGWDTLAADASKECSQNVNPALPLFLPVTCISGPSGQSRVASCALLVRKGRRFTRLVRMTDSGGPQRHTLCFLSTLLSQKVPEKSDAVLRCMISGQPKPEVTWYKNGRAIEECGIVSSYEFFQNQYIHLLHLYRCTPDDTAVYQISAKNCSGMICSSASIEVKCSAENPQLSPNPKDGGDTGWKHAAESSMQEEANQLDEKEHPRRGEESVPSGSPVSADSPSSKFGCSSSVRLLANNDTGASGSENPLDVKGARRTKEARDPDSAEEVADGWLSSKSSNIPDKQHVYCHRAVHSKGSRPVDGALNSDGPHEDVLKSGHPNPRVQKYISFSLPLSVAATSDGPGDRATIQQQGSPQVSSEDSDSDYELCPEITLTCTEEFSDDDLEYLECSDVMTDYSNAVWQRDLEGTGQVFLLESNDEEMEFGSCCPGGREHFLSEMGCGPRVSDDMGPMDATSGFCGNHSQPQEVGVRSSQASTHSPSSLQTGMILTLGPPRDVTSTVTDQARCKLPTASEAAENDYPGIRRETRDSHQAGEEFTSDNLLNMDKAVTETAMKRLSGELENSGVDQWLEIAAEKKVGDEVSLSKRGSEIPAGVRRPETKGKPKKLSPNLKESTTEGTLNLLYPKEPVKRPLAQSDKRDGPHAKAEAVDWNSQFRAGECAVPAQAQQETETLRIPLGPPPQGGNSNFEGEGVLVSTLSETSGVPDGSAHPQFPAPILLKKIQAEMFPDHSGNVKLSCQFAEIHEDSTVWWTKDSKSVAQVQRRADDTSAVSLAIVQASQKDQGIYRCCIKNSYGKATAEFNLTAEVLKQLANQQAIKGCEEIEFSQLIFREDFLRDSYFGDHLRGQIATEELHFGEGVHRKAFRSKVMQGLMPVFQPGHACVLKVHNAVAYGTRNNDELIQRNYKLAAQECYVQNTARYYAKIYAAEAQPLEGFGEVPEIIPIFLIHRPENNIPYATVEEELIGEFVKYSIRDGKEINFLRRESEAGQKCCTFQHWVYQRTSGCLLVTDMQGVGMKLTDVGIATLAKGYKGFKGNCSMTFIDQFKALHQCNKYCKMLGLTSLQNNSQKQKKPAVTKSRIQPNSTTAKKVVPGSPAGKKTSHPL